MNAQDADRASRNAALTLTLALPGDTLLYLLLPLHAAAFGITLPEAGVLLAANRMVRVFGYRWVANFYATRGPRAACLAAAIAAVPCYPGLCHSCRRLAPACCPPALGTGVRGDEHRQSGAADGAHASRTATHGEGPLHCRHWSHAGVARRRHLGGLVWPPTGVCGACGRGTDCTFLCRAAAIDARAHCAAAATFRAARCH